MVQINLYNVLATYPHWVKLLLA